MIQANTTPKLVLVLIAMILVVFTLGAAKVQSQANRLDGQADQIEEIIDAQSPLVFSFENVGQAGAPKVTFIVTCELDPTGKFYACTSGQSGVTTSPPLTPTPVR